MNPEQLVFAELLKLKAFLIGKLSHHHMSVHTQEMLAEVNEAISKVEKQFGSLA